MRLVLVYMVLAIAVMTALTADGMRVTYDSKKYLLGSELMATGRPELASKKLADWKAPIAYPLILSLAQRAYRGNLNVSGFLPMSSVLVRELPWARLVARVGFMLAVAGIFLLAWQVGSALTAHLSAIFFLLFAPTHSLFVNVWTESLFLPLVLFALLALCLYTKGSFFLSGFWFLASAILVCLAVMLRHIGIVLAVAGIAVVMRTTKGNFISTFLWAAIALWGFFFWSQVNHPRSDTYQGFVQLGTFLTTAVRDLGIPLVVILAIGVLFKVHIWWGISLFIGLYLLLLVSLCWYQWIAPPDSSRYLAVTYPFFLIYGAKVIAGAIEGYRNLGQQERVSCSENPLYG